MGSKGFLFDIGSPGIEVTRQLKVFFLESLEIVLNLLVFSSILLLKLL